MAVALANLDMGQHALLNAVLHPLTADPGSPATGQMWWRSDLSQIRVYTGSATVIIADMDDIAGAGGGDMVASVYDPTGVEDDAFARANHAGTQLAATISDFVTTVQSTVNAMTLDADTLDGSTAAQLETAIIAAVVSSVLGNDDDFAATMAAALGTKTEIGSATIGDGTSTTFTVAHGAAGRASVGVVRLMDSSGNAVNVFDYAVGATNIVVPINPAPASGAYTLVWEYV